MKPLGRVSALPALSCAFLLALPPAIQEPVPQPAAPPLPLKVVGATVENSAGQPVWLRGVNCASMEWTNDGEGHILQSVRTAVEEWHANIVRLPLNQDRWFGKAPGQSDGGRSYRALVHQLVGQTAADGAYILLDLHWSDMDQWGQNIGQHLMPDQNSVLFWKSMARAYRNRPNVLFDLYNEPHDVSWQIWREGGTVTEHDRRSGADRTYQAVGLQTLLDTVRKSGARNVVVAGGLDWAYDMSGILNGFALSDPHGSGVIYANHNYPFKGDTVAQWQAKMEQATAKIPVIVSEWGGGGQTPPRFRTQNPTGDNWVRHVLQIMEANHWNWIAWDLHPRAGPSLISDWSYSPTPYFGVWVKDALAGSLPPYTPPAAGPQRH